MTYILRRHDRAPHKNRKVTIFKIECDFFKYFLSTSVTTENSKV